MRIRTVVEIVCDGGTEGCLEVIEKVIHGKPEKISTVAIAEAHGLVKGLAKGSGWVATGPGNDVRNWCPVCKGKAGVPNGK